MTGTCRKGTYISVRPTIIYMCMYRRPNKKLNCIRVSILSIQDLLLCTIKLKFLSGQKGRRELTSKWATHCILAHKCFHFNLVSNNRNFPSTIAK